jgi:hypothetical protein
MTEALRLAKSVPHFEAQAGASQLVHALSKIKQVEALAAWLREHGARRVAVLLEGPEPGRYGLTHADLELDAGGWPVLTWDPRGGGSCKSREEALRLARAPAVPDVPAASGQRLAGYDCGEILAALTRGGLT